jgi:hypothetical protein
LMPFGRVSEFYLSRDVGGNAGAAAFAVSWLKAVSTW